MNDKQTTGKIGHLLWLGAVAPAVLIVGLSLFIFVQFNNVIENRFWVHHTQEVLIAAADVEQLQGEIESGQREYIITGDKDLLRSLNETKTELFDKIGKLKKKISDNPSQAARLENFEGKIKKWLAVTLESEIAARQRYELGAIPFSDVSSLLARHADAHQSEALHEMIGDFIAVEENLNVTRQKTETSSIYFAEALLVAGAAIIVAISLLVGFFSSKIILGDDWVKSNHAKIMKNLQGTTTLGIFSDQLLSGLVPKVSAQTASMYCAHGDTLRKVGGYGTISLGHDSNDVAKGEGLVGQSFATGDEIVLNDIPETYFDIASSLGQAKPRQVMILPIFFESNVIAVIEFASFSELSKRDVALLRSVSSSLGAMINGIMSGVRTEELLQTIKASEERSRGIIDGSIDTIATINRQGIVQSFNKAGEDMFGYQAEEVIGRNVKMLMPAHYAEQHDGYLASYHETGEMRIMGGGREVEARRKDGTEFPIRLAVSSVFIDGEPLYVGILSDITEEVGSREEIRLKSEAAKAAQKRAEEAQKEAEMLFFDAENSRKLAETASKTKSEFLANMSHELRTPLNSLLLLSQDLLENDEGNLTSEQLEDVSVIYNGGKNLLTLINDILDLSKVEAGKMEAVIDDVSIETLMGNAKLSFGPVAEQKGIALNIEASKGVPQTICTDMTRLEQILRNFLSNALKFTHQGSVGLRIFVQDKMPDLIHFAVNDSGIGIPKDKLEAVFNAFEQVDGSISREYGGTGLGLSISLELAALLGGKIQVESKHGQGSTFTLSIPMQLEAKARSGDDQVSFVSPKEMLERAMLQVIQKPPRTLEALVDDRDDLQSGDAVILVVEDDKYFAKILLDKIRAQGFKGLIATDGHGGLQMVSEFRPDAVILDIQLPGIAGTEILAKLRSNTETAEIPVYFMSVIDDIPQLARSEAVGHLVKPVSGKQLEQAFSAIERAMKASLKHLLIVEDDHVLRRTITELVEKRNIHVTAVANATDALEFLRTETPDCMLLDIMLPGMDGIEMLEQIADDDSLQQPRVIVYSAKDLSEAEQKRLELYTSDFVRKNAEPPETALASLFDALNCEKVEAKPDQQPPAALTLEATNTDVATATIAPAPVHVADIPIDAPQGGQTGAPQTTGTKTCNFSGTNILIVDDDARNIFSLSKILRKTGAEISTAQNGKEALAFLEEHPGTNIVLMDVMMPVMNGLEATREIRKHSQLANMPVVAITAKAMQGDKEACLQAGADAYVPKPVEKAILLDTMDTLLAKSA